MAGLYVHIPFCQQRCVYCDFYFVTTQRDHAAFTQALCTELSVYAQVYESPRLETIYFGGGTPSLLAPEALERILMTIRRRYDAFAVTETTLELNPGDAGLGYLRDLRALGVDRLSIGVQSFYEDDLRWMNRSHSAEEAAEIVPLARRAGFENFSVDLIFGLPEQPMERWQANLQKAADLGVPHLSTYGLTVEEKTPLGKRVRRGLTTPAPEEAMERRYRFTMDYLREKGYEHYEISSFAQPDRRAVHNQRYWSHANYLGAGPSAHGFWWEAEPMGNGASPAADGRPNAQRWSNVRNLRRYEALLEGRHLPLDVREPLSLQTLAEEHVLLRLRTSDGLDLAHLKSRYGLDLRAEKPDALARLEADGFVSRAPDDHLRLTDRGKLVCDAVTAALL